VVSLCIVVSSIAERLVEWAAGGLDIGVAYGLSAAIGLTVGWKAAALVGRSGPTERWIRRGRRPAPTGAPLASQL
jgi:hypothetical protein